MLIDAALLLRRVIRRSAALRHGASFSPFDFAMACRSLEPCASIFFMYANDERS